MFRGLARRPRPRPSRGVRQREFQRHTEHRARAGASDPAVSCPRMLCPVTPDRSHPANPPDRAVGRVGPLLSAARSSPRPDCARCPAQRRHRRAVRAGAGRHRRPGPLGRAGPGRPAGGPRGQPPRPGAAAPRRPSTRCSTARTPSPVRTRWPSCPTTREVAQRGPAGPTDNAYPYAAERILSLFADPHRSPDLAIVHTPRHWFPDEGGHLGEHGSLDVIQSRAPLVLSGARIAPRRLRRRARTARRRRPHSRAPGRRARGRISLTRRCPAGRCPAHGVPARAAREAAAAGSIGILWDGGALRRPAAPRRGRGAARRARGCRARAWPCAAAPWPSSPASP